MTPLFRLGDQLIAGATAIAHKKNVVEVGVSRIWLGSGKPHQPLAVRANRWTDGRAIGLVCLGHSTGSTMPNHALWFDANHGVPRANLFLVQMRKISRSEFGFFKEVGHYPPGASGVPWTGNGSPFFHPGWFNVAPL